MANLGLKGGVYVARFRFGGREYKKSLKTSDRRAAEVAMAQVELTLHRLHVGLIALPGGVDPGDYIVSGGAAKPVPPPERPRPVPTLGVAAAEYLTNLSHLSESNRLTVAVHLRNLDRGLRELRCGAAGDDVPLKSVGRPELEAYLQARLRERAGTTVAKERGTIIGLFAWAVGQGHLATSPAAGLTRLKASGELAPFRTVYQVEADLARGGLTRPEAWALWDRVFLNPGEIAEILAVVRRRARRDVSYVLHAIPAFTGMRRGEVLRLRWSDVEFDDDGLVARSRKQSRQAAETCRRIDMHPELKVILFDWQRRRPKGQYVACDPDLASLTPQQANQRFWQPLRGTAWCLASRKNRFKVGFHTYRHSFASNLAAAGVDQRVIDAFMGHTTEAMRKRYRHLFPRATKSAIETFSLAPPPPAGGTPRGTPPGDDA